MPRRERGYSSAMNNFVAILSQLLWGVTIGALSTAAQTLAEAALVIAALCCLGWYGFKWTRTRHPRDRD